LIAPFDDIGGPEKPRCCRFSAIAKLNKKAPPKNAFRHFRGGAFVATSTEEWRFLVRRLIVVSVSSLAEFVD
jgi:hypothetical protein